ncbi:hypothetical protein PVAND_014948 [Polypedilum vanderplanki]|uniref:Leucine rich repeat protein n=1 Tax=Polypedilum vanderplanki TaxID=319348 RepID=A0A9J6BB84_POLVA|nr:hypothetical protein PVAND_014948 [Polypedilum vanderplanki]
MHLQLLIIISFFNLVISNQVVDIKEASIQCNRDVTEKILCEILGNFELNAVIEIVEVQARNKKILKVEEVKDATEVEITIEKLKNFPFGIGSQFHQVEALWIVRSKLCNVEQQNFVHMQQLIALNLYNNKIQHLSSDVFKNLPNLEFLDLDNNQISELHEDLLINQHNLLVFRASKNKIEIIPKNLFRENSKIEQIYLNNNKIREVFVDFRQFLKLIVIDLDENFGNCNFNVGFYDDDDEGQKSNEILMAQAQWNVEQKCRAVNNDEVVMQ